MKRERQIKKMETNKRVTLILFSLVFISFTSCTQGAKNQKTTVLQLKTYSNWETKLDEYNSDAEYYTIAIPNLFSENESAVIQLETISMENDNPNSTISLIDKNGNSLTTIYEPTEFYETAIQNTTVSLGDIDGNGLNDIKIFYPHMGNGLIACAGRIIYLFQEADKSFNKISFENFVCKCDTTEIDVDGEQKYGIVVRNLQYIDDYNFFWVDNLYKYTPDGLVCISEKNGYPKVVNVDKANSTDAEIVVKHKEEWTLPLPNGYHFMKSSDPEASLFVEEPIVHQDLATARWEKYINDRYGFIVEYPNLDFQPVSEGNSVNFGDLFTIVVEEQTSDFNEISSDEILREMYSILKDNPHWVSIKCFGGKKYGYADFYAINPPNIKSRILLALAQNGVYLYKLESQNPDSETVKAFQKILDKFQIVRE